MRYTFIEEQRTQHSIRRMCRLLEVSTAGYYEWRGRPPSHRAIANERLRAEVVRVHCESRKTYGRARVHAELVAHGVEVGVGKVRRLMKSAATAGISPRRFRKTTDSNHSLPIAPNVLARSFDVPLRVCDCDTVDRKNLLTALEKSSYPLRPIRSPR